jgi:hypothetical protein
MRGTNGPMDIVTRAEFDDHMKDIPTKDDLKKGLADTRSEFVLLKNKLEDVKVDILDAIDTKISRAQNLLGIENVKITELRDTKFEILAVTKRSINDAVEPLTAKIDVGFSKMDASHLEIQKSHQAINKSIKELTHFVMEGMGTHENRLKDQEGPS